MSFRRMIKFAVVGVSNTSIDMALFTILVSLFNWSIWIANVLSYGAGILNSFLLNKYWTFRDPKPLHRSLRSGVLFLFVSLIGLLISTTTVVLLAYALPVLVAKGLSVVIVFGWNYGMSHWLVFANGSRPT